ncbi:FAD-dependent oxidoreductase [Streptomyces sp. BPTC-684]|uniref:FAD-dependent oxidoreductase n=1 Tax=Streptomyces sp. BPTC-684 TaxID=3043734 RepID=UPI0024B11165|nr:FAD-dependent oxidoreductase [Streptomyces sp. BPTC-684]WHM35540.1 FAD-dependent oxidoreductase [Streptomyces sp. BPTC-684]
MSERMIVLGGGVIGLTTAVVLAESGRHVRVWSRDPVGETTSAVAGALWWPYRIEPAGRVGDWALASLRVYEELAADPGRTGVRLVEGLQSGIRLSELGPWAAGVDGLHQAPDGVRARIPLIDMPVHLAWLRGRLEAAGGTVEIRELGSLPDDAPVVVNCTGLGARSLVPDPGVRPVRGQLVVVENPGVTEWYTSVDHSSPDTTYFFPQPYGLLLGGTAQNDAWDLVPDPRVAEEIVARCARVRPEIAGARVLAHRVGLRPVRDAGVRIGAETTASGGLLVHNYGHGGAGVTVAWGCAREAAALAASRTPLR